MSIAKTARTRLARRWLRLAALMAVAASLTGCMTPGAADPSRTGPFYVPTNVRADPSLGGIRRVVVLPVWSGEAAPAETAAELDAVVVAALQDSKRFEVVSLSREAALRKFRLESLSSVSALPHGMFETLQRDFAADAVLFVDITVYRAYRPLAIGLRSKLTKIAGAHQIWAFDNVFSADDASVANAARNHFIGADQRAPVDLTHGVLQSPSRFATYATTAMFATLPPVLPPPMPKTAPSSNR
ncbi:MAG: hypothetical protein V4773_17140 [Verrucomicrobiota bacterium]